VKTGSLKTITLIASVDLIRNELSDFVNKEIFVLSLRVITFV